MGPCRTLGAGRRVLRALEPAGRGFPRTAQGPQLRDAIRRSWEAQHRVYSPRRVWRQRRREGQRVVARCTVERLTAEMGLRGATRGRVDHDDAIGPATERREDLVERSPRPGRISSGCRT